MTTELTIVPLYGREALGPAAAPRLSYGNGPLLTSVEVYTVFWGAAWGQKRYGRQASQVNRFFDFVLTSSLLDLLAEYGAGGQTIGHGQRIGSTTVTGSEPGSSLSGAGSQVTDAEIQQALQGWIQDGTLPRPTANTLYFVYLPPGVTVVDSQNDRSCQTMCGYHWYVTGTNPVYYAVMPYPDCSGCLGSLSAVRALTSTSSHELCEAITDPQPWTGWNDPSNGEIGDICGWQTQTLHGYTVQKEWSNAQGACVVAPA